MMSVSRKHVSRAGWTVALAISVAGMPVTRAQEAPAGVEPEPAPAAPGATTTAGSEPAAPGATAAAGPEQAERGDSRPRGSGRGAGREKPWNRGVPMATRLRARAIYHEGNSFLNIPLFAQAAEKYQEALALYPHPAIYFNLALAQLNLVQPVESYHSFSRALEHGPGPLGDEHHRRGRQYLERLERQLGHVEVTCAQPGAAVTMDGRPLFTGPGRWQGVVVPGEHQILASADGLIPAAERVVVSAGERTAVALSLQRPARTVTERYLPAWIPWASLGVGAGLLGAGGYYDRKASDAWGTFDDYVDGRCPVGCTDVEAPELAPRHAQATSDTRMARGFYVAGGVALVGSAVLLYVNRERVVRRADRDGMSIAPVLAPGSAGVAVRGDF